MRTPKLSVILCTYNPRPEALRRCLGSLAAQNMPASDYELIIIDNCSMPPLNKAAMEAMAGRDLVLVREMRPGLIHARASGFRNAEANLVVFIDDDNEFMPDYLSEALHIAEEEPRLGVFGGRCIGAFEHPPGHLKKFFLPFLGVREGGDEPLTGEGREWGPHEPIGAGIVVRKPVGILYSDFVDGSLAGGGLGRTGNQLMAGEDSLLSRLAHQAGYLCGYRPRLQLMHHIEPRRLEWSYLARLMKGHGISYVRLARICGRDFQPVGNAMAYKIMLKNLLHRTRRQGLVAAAAHLFWDIGFYEAVREVPAAQPATAAPARSTDRDIA